MDLEAIAPILEDIIRQSLYEKRYQFGFANYKGRSNKVASGTLARSVEVKVKGGSRNISRREFLQGKTGNDGLQVLQVLMEEYGQWVQSGRMAGKGFVPVGSLMKWIKQRGLKGRDKKGRYMTDKSFAYAIQKNINKICKNTIYGLPKEYINENNIYVKWSLENHKAHHYYKGEEKL